MKAELDATIRDGWAEWGFGAQPGRLSYLLLTGGERSINKIVCLVFADSAPRPRVAVKIPRVAASIEPMRREARVLRAVQALRPQAIAGVPRVLFCHDIAGLLMLGETALSGVPIHTHLRTRGYRELALAATTWLAQLAGRPEPSPRAVWWDRLIAPVLARFSATFGAIVEPALLQKTADILGLLGDMPIVCEQRDFSPWNVLLSVSGDLIVLDWESAELQGLPAIDLIYFLSYLAFYHDGAMMSRRFLASYRALRDPTTPTGRVVSECMERYADAVGLAPTALQPLRLLTWLLHSRSEYQHLEADAAGPPAPDALRSSLFFRLWHEEVVGI